MLTPDLEAHIKQTVPTAVITYRRKKSVELCSIDLNADLDLPAAHGLAGYVCRQSGFRLESVTWLERKAGGVAVTAITLMAVGA